MLIRLLRSCALLLALCGAALPAAAKDGPGVSKPRTKKHVVQAPHVNTLVSATHPTLSQESMAAGSVLRVTGVGFGDPLDGFAVVMAAGVEEGVTLTVVSWKDTEILLQLPSVYELGIDATTEAALMSELTPEKPVLSMNASISLRRGTANLVEPFKLRIALAALDFDSDGFKRGQDANDLDPQVH